MKKKLIIADDDRIISNIVVRAFEETYDVVVCKNGREAIDTVKNNVDDSIVAMLLDLKMPEVDGFAVLEYFKQNNLFSRIPVCIITGNDARDVINQSFSYDIVDIIQKPFTVIGVKEEVEKLVNLKNY